MIYHFTWNSDYLVNEAVLNWKNIFLSKYWDFNLTQIKNLNEFDKNFLAECLISSSFLFAKKFIIINIWNTTKEFISEEKQDYFLSIFEKIPNDNIVLFVSINPDKRWKFYKFLKEKAENKEFNLKDSFDLKKLLEKRYQNKISSSAINTLITYKSSNLSIIIKELDKLFITIDYIKESDITEHITPELEESIFQLIDDLLNLKPIQSLEKINIILNNTNIYAFYNNLLANLRINIYIYKLKNLWLNQLKITNELALWNRWFLVNKSYKISFSELEKFYLWLINLDKKMKTGNLIWTEEKDFKLEIDKLVLGII